MSTTSYDQTLSLFASLSFTEKLSFMADAAIAVKKEGKTGSVGKAAKKEKKEKDSDAPKRKMSPGANAWTAFVKHCKETMPERFEGLTRPDKKMSICSEIKKEDPEAYESFAAKFIAEAEASAAKPEVKTPVNKAEEIAKFKEAAAKKKVSAAAPAAEEKAVKATPEKKVKEEKPAKAPAAPKKGKSKAVAAEEKTEDDLALPIKEIGGERYHFDSSSNGLWKVEGEKGFGAWVGIFQPDNEEEPIKYTESAAD